MAKIKLNGDTSGYIEISAPAVSGNNTLELGPGTKILTNLDNTFTGVSTFTSGLHVTGGSFGLGTDNPQKQLQILGDSDTCIRVTSTAGGYSSIQFGDTGDTVRGGVTYYSGDDSLELRGYNNSTRLRILSTGTVNIGDQGLGDEYLSSTVKIRKDQNSVTRLSVRNENSGSGSASAIQVGAHGNSWMLQCGSAANDSNAFTIRVDGSANSNTGTEKLRITTGGDVLIADTTNSIYDDNSGGGMNLKANGQLVLKKQAVSTADPLMWLNDTGQTTNKFILFAQDGNEKASIGLAGNDLRFARDGYNETLRITSGGDVNILGGILNLGTADVSSAHLNSYELMTFNIDTDNDDSNRYFAWFANSNSASGIERMRLTEGGELGINVTPAAGDGATYNNWRVPKLHVKGNSDSNEFHLLGRFVAGNDADNTGAQIVIHHENDRGMALQGGRSSSNRSYGAIKSLDNLAREATVMDFRGDNGQGVDYIKFYTGSSNSTTEQFKIDSSGRVYMPNQPRFFAWGNSSINMTTTGYHTWATFNNTRFNIGNNFSTSTKLFTAPVNGTYAFGCNCRIDAGGVGYFRIILSINGSSADNDQGHSIRNADAANAFYHSQEVTALYQLSANDNVRVIVEANSDSSWTMQSESQFWGYLVA